MTTITIFLRIIYSLLFTDPIDAGLVVCVTKPPRKTTQWVVEFPSRRTYINPTSLGTAYTFSRLAIGLLFFAC